MKSMRLDDHASVAVVGLGPGGLAAALVKQVAFEYSQSEPDVKINYGA